MKFKRKKANPHSESLAQFTQQASQLRLDPVQTESTRHIGQTGLVGSSLTNA